MGLIRARSTLEVFEFRIGYPLIRKPRSENLPIDNLIRSYSDCLISRLNIIPGKHRGESIHYTLCGRDDPQLASFRFDDCTVFVIDLKMSKCQRRCLKFHVPLDERVFELRKTRTSRVHEAEIVQYRC